MLATYNSQHVQQALARQMQEYKQLTPAFINVLNGTNPYIPTGTYTPFFSAAPGGVSLGFGYGSLVGVGQAFNLAAPTDVGQITFYFQSSGIVTSGYIAAYLYADNGASPNVYAAPIGGPIQQSVEVYNAADVASQWVADGATGYISLTFTFDFTLPVGYYWVVLGSNFLATPGNSLLIGLNHTGGLAFANGTGAGSDVTGFFGPNGSTGIAQIAMQVASKTSAPPLQPSNNLNVSGFGVLLSTFADRMQVLENAAFPINEGRQLFNGSIYPAIGAQLDGIGQIVGIARNGLSDAEYLIFILGQIGENYSNGTIPQIAALISLIFQTNSFLLMPLYPAEMDVQIPSTAGLPSSLYSQAITLITKSIDAGVGIGFGSIAPANSFAFTSIGGPQVGGGFGSTTQSGGGGFAELFYSNPGV